MAEIAANTVVMVTGASAGLGRAIAHALGARGARLGLLAQGWDGLEGARRVEAAGGKALAVPADVSSEDQVEAAARAVENAFGPIDVWVNNAMVSIFSPVKQMTSSEFRRVMDVTTSAASMARSRRSGA
jgi:NAD(P)-dependent dehydrogenase (short-subunit alcohol dehydrogenase family)